MASYGFSADHINLIADNLRDRYKNGFSIIKELIQNADDAKARKLVFGLHPGFKDKVKHTLLQGPGLWVFNDGNFKSEDQKAIRSFGLNSKAGDSGSIGKFGLGMKSVFHLCEAFFYIAFDGEKNIDVFLNPWDENNDDDMHSDWKQVAQSEFDAIRTVATDKKLIDDCATWFLLWIPLRQKVHVLQKDSEYSVAIIDKYPGDAGSTDLRFLLDNELSQKIQLILPILKNIETIELIGSQQQEASFNGFKVQIDINSASKRIDHISADLLSIGVVSSNANSKEKLHFRIQQKTLVDAEPFTKFKQLNAWPKMGSLNKLGKRESVADKSYAEGAVMISSAKADGERAALDIHWAVFLPTEEGVSYKFLLDGGQKNYRIVLHGQFFVDAGRRGIVGSRHLSDKLVMPAEDLDDIDLHTGWNQAIAQQVVLPMLLPTLAKYAQDNLNASETEELARSILVASTSNNSATGIGKKFWDTFKNFICDGQAWVRIITLEGVKWSYEKIQPNTRLLKLPPPPKHDPMRAWKVLPHLQKLSINGCVLLDEDAPSLFLTPSNWDDEIILSMLKSVNYDEACSETGMAYLEKFLSMEQLRYINSSEVQRALIALLKKMLRDEPLKTFRSARLIFQNLVSLVNSEYRFSIGTKKISAITSLDDATFKLLINAGIDKLFLPMDLDPELNSASKGKPDQDEIRILFKLIDKEILKNINSGAIESINQVEVFLRAAQMILNLLPEKGDERGQAIRVNRSLKILSATCARTHKKQAISFDDLHHAHEHGLLFKEGFGAGVGAMYSTAIAFSKLIPSEQVWVISGEVAEWIDRGDGKNNSGIPSATDSNAAYKSLGKHGKALELASDIQIRCEFIRNQSPTLIKCDEMKRGVRYVLHGSHKHYGDMESALWINADTEDAVWVKLKGMIEPDSWSLIDTQLSGAIKSDDWRDLKIRKIGQEQVLEYMRSGCNLNLIDASKFSQSEINIILKKILYDDLWRNIPLHRDLIGGFGAITDNCYIDSKKIANPILISGCRILIASEDKNVGDRQQKIIPSWSHVVTIKRALEQSAPVDYCQLILDTLGCTDEKQLGSLSELRLIKWLPLKQEGLCISPEDVIDLDESLADEIDRLAAECGYCYAGISALSIDVTKHKNYKNIRDLFASGTSALERLGQLMVAADGYLVGEFVLPEGEELKDYIESLAQLKSLPGWDIANRACVATKDEDVINVEKYLLKELFQPITVDKLVQLLKEIPTLGKSKKLTSIFNIYLKQLVAYGIQTKAEIASLKLMACNGSWKNASDLCVGVEGVDSAYLLNKEQAIILGEMVFQRTIKNTVDSADFSAQNSTKNHVQVVKEYFQPWRELMQPAPIGGLLSLLGLSFREMAVEFLNPHTIDNFIEKIIWNDPSARNNQVWDYQRPGGYSKSVALDMIDFIPTISDAKSILVESLLDAPLFVSCNSSYNSLIIGNITWAGRSTGRHTFILPLRMISDAELKEYDKVKLSGLIRKTCECILKQAYNQRNVDLDVWESLEKSDQLELEVARELILNRLPYDLRNIKATKKNAKLKEALDNLINFERDRAGKKSNQQTIAEVDQNIVTAKAALATLMCNDHSVQATVLKGIREKVKQNQYNVSSIAFELLQNADDAVMELKLLMNNDSAAAYSQEALERFVINSQVNTVRFVHWGRPVNFMGYGAGRREAHGEDLQRMLVLAASEKEDTSGLTGKFGLGFKSVLLATDIPCIFSGDLNVKILGGCLPEPWTDVGGAVEILNNNKIENVASPRGTIIEFRVVELVKIEEVLNRFTALAGFQCIFSKEIRSIQVNEQIHKWSPSRLIKDISCAEVGTVQIPTKTNTGSRIYRLLNLRLENSCLAFVISSRGCSAFSEGEFSPPSVWVTAPTNEAPAKRVILNGSFALDTGRGGLPHGENAKENLNLAESIGRDAAIQVRKLVMATRDEWPATQENLKLNKNLTAAEFWGSFLDSILLAKDCVDVSESERLLGRLGHSFYQKYLTDASEIPNGLPGEKSEFVQLKNISLSLNAQWVKHFLHLRNYAIFTEKYPVEGWISDAVSRQLEDFEEIIENEIPAMSVSLLLDCVPDGCCSPEMAIALAEILIDLPLDEQVSCKSSLEEFCFMASDGAWKQGCYLLKNDCPQDAPYIAFAPKSHVIDERYVRAGLDFIKLYSPCEVFDYSKVAQWILNAITDRERVGALMYLLSCHQNVKLYLGNRINNTWLDGLIVNSKYLVEFTISEKNQLLVMFKKELIESEEVEVFQDTEFPDEPLQGEEALIAIHDWWQADGDKLLKDFDRDFWPNSVPRNFLHESDSRAAWMTLFAIGLMQRYGRVQNNQNRGYIDHMQSKGWWDIFSNVDPHDDGQAWLNVLNEYGELQDDHEKFSMWMDSFPRLYRIACWFDNYRHIFESLNYRNQDEVISITSPNADPVLSGSHIYAPSLVRGLKLGQHVVIRELLRCGVLSSDTAKSLAFKPSRSVKRLFSSIGLLNLDDTDISSQSIYGVLQDILGDSATFDGAYDIPLQILALDESLQQKILRAVAVENLESDESDEY